MNPSRETRSHDGRGVKRAHVPCSAVLFAALLSVLVPSVSVGSDLAQHVRASSEIDDRIGGNVAEVLFAKDNVKPEDLLVTVQNGIVTLEGTVSTSAEKHLASRYTRDVTGVQGVVNAIIVNPALKPEQADARLKTNPSAPGADE